MWRVGLVAPLLVAACADAKSPQAIDARPAAGEDAAPPADAAATAAADADRGDCLAQVPLDYGTRTPVDTTQYEHDGGYTFYADLAPDSEPFQRLFIVLHADSGVFSGSIEPGTYTLEDDETDYQQCGACVYLAVQDGPSPSTLYMARAGKLRVDSVGGQIRGELTSAALRQIEIEYSGDSCPGDGEWPCGNTACTGGQCGVPVEGPDCETFVQSLSF